MKQKYRYKQKYRLIPYKNGQLPVLSGTNVLVKPFYQDKTLFPDETMNLTAMLALYQLISKKNLKKILGR